MFLGHQQHSGENYWLPFPRMDSHTHPNTTTQSRPQLRTKDLTAAPNSLPRPAPQTESLESELRRLPPWAKYITHRSTPARQCGQCTCPASHLGNAPHLFQPVFCLINQKHPAQPCLPRMTSSLRGSDDIIAIKKLLKLEKSFTYARDCYYCNITFV